MLDPTGTVTPLLSGSSGQAGQPLHVTLDSTGFPVGTYTTSLTLSANPAVPNSPVTIPITMIIAEEVSAVYLPLLLGNW